MQISLVFGYTCPCGCPSLGWMVYTVRVNKGSLRAVGRGLGMVPTRCGDCSAELAAAVPVESVWVHDEDREKLNEKRARKGWPPLTDWRLVPRESGRLEVVA